MHPNVSLSCRTFLASLACTKTRDENVHGDQMDEAFSHAQAYHLASKYGVHVSCLKGLSLHPLGNLQALENMEDKTPRNDNSSQEFKICLFFTKT